MVRGKGVPLIFCVDDLRVFFFFFFFFKLLLFYFIISFSLCSIILIFLVDLILFYFVSIFFHFILFLFLTFLPFFFFNRKKKLGLLPSNLSWFDTNDFFKNKENKNKNKNKIQTKNQKKKLFDPRFEAPPQKQIITKIKKHHITYIVKH